MSYHNPVLEGFHPDPSLLLVGADYYIAVSTFEWYPGVRIYHSTDLGNWEYITAPLDCLRLADLAGCQASDGIWAPHLSYDGEKFYIIYTIVHGARTNPVMDVSNYLIEAKSIMGPWSNPVYLNSSGFDPSLFHDMDGKKWIVNMEWDYRKVCAGGHPFTGILIQEYSSKEKRLVGEPEKIFTGTEIGSTEGPQIFKRNGYYYLVCAEGGTGWFHAVTVARSRRITGPYEVHPNNPVLSSWEGSFERTKVEQEKQKYGIGNSYLKKAGHGSFCETSKGNWYLAHLCARSMPHTEYCPMGRETAIQQIIWENDWPYLRSEGRLPQNEFCGETEEKNYEKRREICYTFETDDFLNDFQTLRKPLEELGISRHEKKGCLRIYGRESIFSVFNQALIARRQADFCFCAETTFTFVPKSFQQSAGLIYRYDEKNQYYAYISYDEKNKNVICLLAVKHGKTKILSTAPIRTEKYTIGVEVNNEEIEFYYWEDDVKKQLYEALSTEVLSDEYADGFTGAFIGMAVQDLKDRTVYADFNSFLYRKTGKQEEK